MMAVNKTWQQDLYICLNVQSLILMGYKQTLEAIIQHCIIRLLMCAELSCDFFSCLSLSSHLTVLRLFLYPCLRLHIVQGSQVVSE